MSDLESHVSKAIFYNSQGGERPVPPEIIVANCRMQGYAEADVIDELERLVEEGDLLKEDDGYLRAED